MTLTLDNMRRYAIARSIFAPTTLPKAVARLGFVQADPICAPARAQDLTLFQRVCGYKVGDLELRYPKLGVEEDHFINYGFVTREIQSLMHPREARLVWTKERWAAARTVQAFVLERGVVHPREVDAHFAFGKVTNWFGGSSNASTQLLDGMHYRGLLRVARRENGTRLYEAVDWHTNSQAIDPDAALDVLMHVAIAKYAPLPAQTLGLLASAIARSAVPHWKHERAAALKRAKERLAHATISTAKGEVLWYWPEDENPSSKRHQVEDRVRLLAPFDPVVWDRLRFELFWDWAYRFEAYTPAPKRKLGYYALPLLWRDEVVGWANLKWKNGQLETQLGYVAGEPARDSGFGLALDEELDRMTKFLTAR